MGSELPLAKVAKSFVGTWLSGCPDKGAAVYRNGLRYSSVFRPTIAAVRRLSSASKDDPAGAPGLAEAAAGEGIGQGQGGGGEKDGGGAASVASAELHVQMYGTSLGVLTLADGKEYVHNDDSKGSFPYEVAQTYQKYFDRCLAAEDELTARCTAEGIWPDVPAVQPIQLPESVHMKTGRVRSAPNGGGMKSLQAVCED